MLLSLLASQQGQRILTIDLDPECGTSRDFLGSDLKHVRQNVRTFLESPIPMPPPVISSGIEGLDLVPCEPDQQRFFRYFPEHSLKLQEGLAFLPPAYRWIIMDVPNQFDNIAELGLIAADWLILPVELTADCADRVSTALRTIQEARAMNPGLRVLGALPLASAPRAGRPRNITAKENLVYEQYADSLGAEGVELFKTIMFRSATTVEEARSNADPRLLHWTARKRFQRLLAEIHARIKTFSLSSSPSPHEPVSHPRREKAAANR
ncbi:MAG TPA: ParA family protein [Pirellulales bacterium]|nr:ParA family protein [Pirellulales bacterium]